MKLATLKDGSRDGRLVVVSRDLRLAADAAAVCSTLQFAIEHWDWVEPDLQAISDALNAGEHSAAFAFDPRQAMAPLPRAYQFIDASAFLNHGDIMERAFNLTVQKDPGVPIVLQRQGDDFAGPHDDYPFPNEADNADFEGEYAVIVDDIAMGTSAAEAERHIKLITILNDVSMRAHLSREMALGFGFVQAKTATVFAPVAVTPDELGAAWQQGRVALDMHVRRNGEWFGNPNGREMDFSFGQLLAHLAYNRNLRAGTIVGSGTVSNRNHADVGSACLAERRALEVLAHGAPRSPFLQYGDTVRFEVLDATGQSLFGAIEHRMVPAASAA